MENEKNWTDWDQETRKRLVEHFGEVQTEQYLMNSQFTQFMHDKWKQGKTTEEFIELTAMGRLPGNNDKFYIA